MPPLSPTRNAAALVLLCFASPSHAGEDTQFWLQESATAPLNGATNLIIDLGERFREARIGNDQYVARFTIDHRIAPGVEIGAGFTWQGTGPQNEYRPHEQLTVTLDKLVLRTRLEERMVDTAPGTSWRLRQRIAWSPALGSHGKLTGTLNAEGFFQLNSTAFATKVGLAMVRTQVGLRRALSGRFTLGLLYQRQQVINSGKPDSVNHEPLLVLQSRF